MSLGHGAGIVRNGLVLYLDAANSKSYPGAGTTWNDLSGQANNGTLTNGPTYSSANNGSIVFDGVNDYINTSVTTAFADFTVCSWFKSTGSVGYARIADKNYETGFWFGRNGGATNQWGGGVKQTANYNSITLIDGVWNFLVMVRSGTSLTVYGNGITNKNITVCGAGLLSSTALSIGGTINDGGGLRDWFNGQIPYVTLYNRALSAAEITQNFEATRGRYGI